MKIECFNNVSITYMRAVGEYGIKNKELVDTFKSYLKERGLMDRESTIFGIAMDNPEITPKEELRYDVGVLSDNSDGLLDLPTRKIADGEYAIFEIDHTAEAVQGFWSEINDMNSDINRDFDKPILERYQMKMVQNNRCEFCVPIKTSRKLD